MYETLFIIWLITLFIGLVMGGYLSGTNLLEENLYLLLIMLSMIAWPFLLIAIPLMLAIFLAIGILLLPLYLGNELRKLIK